MASETGNFQYIYSNDQNAKEFYPFLVNVFHLFPEKDMHLIIKNMTKKFHSDKDIYIEIQKHLKEIKPLLGDLTYALPSLKKQKEIMSDQTRVLLPEAKEINGYLEIGSKGRYLDALEHSFLIENIELMDDKEAGYNPIDIVERGQIKKAGNHVDFNDYKPKKLKSNNYDLITMYIGMHHCPIELRNEFLTNLRDGLSNNGSFILRDHDAHNEKMLHTVSLAHDVFNVGTMESWQTNEDERRNFYSLNFLEQMMNENGFKRVGKKIYQQGDPSLNALMRFIKA